MTDIQPKSNKDKMNEFDIVISGGGMVGSLAALALAKLDLKIALVEPVEPQQINSPSFDQRAVALSAASVAIFKTLGLWDPLQSLAEPIKKIHISDQGRFGFARLDCDDYAMQALGEVLPLDQTGPLLWQAMRQHNNIDIFSANEVIDINSQPQQVNYPVTVIIQDKQTQVSRSLNTRLLLGADGTFSSVAKIAGIKTKTTDYQQHAIIANISVDKPHQNRAFERFTQHGPLALLPLTRNRLSLVWCQKPQQVESLMSCDDSQFIKKLQLEFGYRLGQITKVGQRVNYPLVMRVANKPYTQGVLLLGNAAHTLHPIAGQGFNIGIRDVAALCDAVSQVKQTARNSIGDLDFLEKYHASRQRDWDKTIVATDFLVRIFSHDFLPLAIARDKALNILDKIPLVKQALAKTAMGLSGQSAKLTRGIPIGLQSNEKPNH